uniref:Myosin motor domain-containing protein n=1 Tax=Anisakis simplex TaxID=6269 RepID=A0A0M3J401_ANISI
LKVSQGNTLLNEIWSDYVTQEEASKASKSGGHRKGKSGSFMTVSMLYRESLNNLMSMLYSTHPHFIRCIIPNEKKKSGLLDAALVLNQLTCNGVLEGIRICRKGFPNRLPHPDFVERYALLCADESTSSPDPKECVNKMLEKLISEGSMNENMFKVGLTKVFFKAGVLAHLEDLRDMRLAQLIAGFQAEIRHYCKQVVVLMLWLGPDAHAESGLKWPGILQVVAVFFLQHFRYDGWIDLKERREKLAATIVIQTNVSDWANLMRWPWLSLFINTMPIVRASKLEEVMEQVKVDISSFEQKITLKNREREELEEQLRMVLAQKNAIIDEIKSSKSGNTELEDQIDHLTTHNTQLETDIDSMTAELRSEEERTEKEKMNVKKLEEFIEGIRKSLQDAELGKRKSAAEKTAKDNQMHSLREEIAQQETQILKLQKERKAQNERMTKLKEDLREREQRNENNAKMFKKLEQSTNELEDEVQTEKRRRSDSEKEKRKVEGDVRIERERIDEIEQEHKDLQSRSKRKEAESHSLSAQLEQEQAALARLAKQCKECEVKAEALEEERDAECAARSRAER